MKEQVHDFEGRLPPDSLRLPSMDLPSQFLHRLLLLEDRLQEPQGAAVIPVLLTGAVVNVRTQTLVLSVSKLKHVDNVISAFVDTEVAAALAPEQALTAHKEEKFAATLDAISKPVAPPAESSKKVTLALPALVAQSKNEVVNCPAALGAVVTTLNTGKKDVKKVTPEVRVCVCVCVCVRARARACVYP